ncbi:MAG: NYN domain-containing protein [Bacteroidetes bacterium SW_9_63_38]|nr:MAG: NYN domain-containing protein [Bacteroidetes bacterium SW_9_63_38]
MNYNSDSGRSERAAMFIDYENLYSVLTSQSSTDSKTSEYATEILNEVQRYLEEGDDTPTIFGRAYGPFDVLLNPEDSGVPSTLHRLGTEPSYVPAAMQSNASEVQLTIDVTQFLERRPDVQTIVIATGDRPFLPLVRTIQEQGRRALVAAVNPPQTDRYEESDLYLDARNLLSADSREDLLANVPETSADDVRPASTRQRHDSITNEGARRALAITEAHFGQYEEVYLTPLLRKLSDVMGPDHDPKALVSELEAVGAVRLEKRSGYPYDYTVLIVHDDHPDVQDIRNNGLPDADLGLGPSSNGADAEYDEADEEVYEPHDYDEYTMDEALSSPSDAEPDADSADPEATDAHTPSS